MSFIKAHLIPFGVAVAAVVVGLMVAPKVAAAFAPKQQG